MSSLINHTQSAIFKKICFFHIIRYIIAIMKLSKTKKIIRSLFCISILGCAATVIMSATAVAMGPKHTAKVIALKGAAEIRVPKAKDWVPAKAGSILNEGDILKTDKDSSAVIELDGKDITARIVAEEHVQLLFLKLASKDKKGVQKTLLDLGAGKITVTTARAKGERSTFEIKTPTSIIDVKEGTITVKVEGK